jgi:ABC-2 type transport system ATP-binding protein
VAGRAPVGAAAVRGGGPAVRVRGLGKCYGRRRAVADVSFDVGAGEIVAVLGPNGAGKTTTVEILEGFLRRDAGEVAVLGEDPATAGRRWRSRIGVMPQETRLEGQLTVRETLRLYAGLYPRPRDPADVLGLTGLTQDADRRVGTLSGGRQRRVDLALAMVGSPRLLFLDEPTTGFDPAARRLAWEAITALARAGATVILTTHYLEEADRLADRVVVLGGGRVLADAPPEAIRARTAGRVVAFRLPDSPPEGAPATAPPLPDGAVRHPGGRVEIATADVHRTVTALVDWSRAARLPLAELTVSSPSLEDAYLALTGAGAEREEGRHV